MRFLEKIIQIIKTENDHTWQGKIVGLSNMGRVYELSCLDGKMKWVLLAERK